MNYQDTKTFVDALDAAGIKSYVFDIDDGTHLYHGVENGIIKFAGVGEMMVAFRPSKRSTSTGLYGGNMEVVTFDPLDAHRVTAGATYEQAVAFAEAMGIELTAEEKKLIITLDKKNVDIKPETGDYNRFHYLSQKEYDALTPEEKAAYDAAKAAYEEAEAKYVGQNQAATITVG